MRIRLMTRRSIAAAAMLALAACSKADKDKKPGDQQMRAAIDSAMAKPAEAPSPPALTDANIAAILDYENMADSAAGMIASTKGTNAEIKAYGKMIAGEHHALRQQGQALVAKLKVTPALPADFAGEKFHSDAMGHFTSMAKGAEWDRMFIAHEVENHEQLKSTVQAALAAAQNAELKALIEKAMPAVQKHLDQAKAIEAKIPPAA